MKKYYIEDSDGVEVLVPTEIVKEIVRDYLANTYYWALTVGCLTIGFLFGITR